MADSKNGDAVEPVLDGKLEVGRRLKSLRRERHLTLADVASATGLSASFLSLVEQGKSDIAIGRLTRLAVFFGATVADMTNESNVPDPIAARNGKARNLVSPEEGITVDLFTPIGSLAMMPYRSTFEPGGATAEFASHEGEEFFYVLEGEIALELEGVEEATYGVGDLVYFHSRTPHRFRNPGKKPAILIGAVTPPSL